MQVYFVCLPQATEPKVASVIFQLTWIKAVAGDNGWLEVSELSVHVAVECRGEGALSVYYHLRVLVLALISGFGCMKKMMMARTRRTRTKRPQIPSSSSRTTAFASAAAAVEVTNKKNR